MSSTEEMYYRGTSRVQFWTHTLDDEPILGRSLKEGFAYRHLAMHYGARQHACRELYKDPLRLRQTHLGAFRESYSEFAQARAGRQASALENVAFPGNLEYHSDILKRPPHK